MKDTLFKHESDEWETPDHIFEKLDQEFHFTLDPCCTEQTHKCEKYYTVEQDGLKQNWGGESVFCNPPYSNAKEWVRKAFYESKKDKTVVVLLLPSRTDVKYFHDFIYHRAEVRFVKGRIRFSNSKYNAPFPSMIVIFRGAYV